MKLRQLFESKGSTVGIIFGRFNPPHMGHMKAWEMASENDHWFVGTNQSTQGPKDPLPYDIKVKAMQAVWPDIKGHIVAETSWLTLASKVYKKYGSIVLNVYTDEDWVTKTLIQYNGKEGAHGFYNFKDIEQQVTPRLSSATSLRNAVAADDRDLFGQAAGVDPNTLVAGHPFFDVVKHYLMPHAEKAAAKVAKKKVKEPVAEDEFGVMKKRPSRAGSRPERSYKAPDQHGVTELSTELLGRYKKAAGTDAKAADTKGDYARGNKRFSGIVKATKKQFANDEKGVAENKLGEMIPWPAVANKIGSAMKAMGWKAQRKGDDAFMFSTKGAEDESQYYMVMIDNEGDGMFSYALGTFEGGRPDIGEHGKLPTTEASVSEVLMAIRDGYGLDETVTENAWDRLQREKALESAGVGIITKQNSTVDVNKNTPKKNLKAFRLI